MNKQITIAATGSMEIYYLKTSDDCVKHLFYWKDKYCPDGCGPFKSVYEAMKHYEKLIKLDKEAAKRGLHNVIEIDFVNKKRFRVVS